MSTPCIFGHDDFCPHCTEQAHPAFDLDLPPMHELTALNHAAEVDFLNHVMQARHEAAVLRGINGALDQIGIEHCPACINGLPNCPDCGSTPNDARGY